MMYKSIGANRARRCRRRTSAGDRKGIKEIRAESLSYTSDQEFQPLSELEEAMLIAAIGNTGLSMPDRPFEDEQGRDVMGTPNCRFPAHADALQVPGIWLQAHHLDLAYYDKLFREGYTEKHRDHDDRWHAGGN